MSEPKPPLDQEEQAQLLAIFQTFLSLPNSSELQLQFFADTSGALVRHNNLLVLFWHDMEEGVEMLAAYRGESTR